MRGIGLKFTVYLTMYKKGVNIMSSYDKRELEIIEKLQQGRTRADIAEDYNYTTWKSLDIFMRRRDYIWNGDANIYEPETTHTESIRDQLISNIPIKAEQVINRIAEGEDPRQIAKSLGFDGGHREMADYLDKSGLIWSSSAKNYVEKDIGDVNSKVRVSSEKHHTDDFQRSKKEDFEKNINLGANLGDLEKYLPLFELLYENKERLSELLLGSESGSMPKYIVPGPAKTKSIYMNDRLSRLMADFSATNNISQREIVETSIILYLKQFGGSYKKDIERLLDQI